MTIASAPQNRPVVIRRAGVRDVEAIRALTRAAYAKWVPILGREPRPMGADYLEAVARHRIDLADVEGEIVGLVETVDEPECLLIESVAVSLACQGRGLGRRLLRHAETIASSAGLPRIRLYTNRLMAANVALYRGLGYVEDREEVNRYGTVVHLSKAVPKT